MLHRVDQVCQNRPSTSSGCISAVPGPIAVIFSRAASHFYLLSPGTSLMSLGPVGATLFPFPRPHPISPRQTCRCRGTSADEPCKLPGRITRECTLQSSPNFNRGSVSPFFNFPNHKKSQGPRGQDPCESFLKHDCYITATISSHV